MKILLTSLLLLANLGCATRSYVDIEVSSVKRDARRRTLASHSDLIDEIDRVETRIKILRNSVLTSSEMRSQLHRAYWNTKLNAHQDALEELRQEIIPADRKSPIGNLK